MHRAFLISLLGAAVIGCGGTSGDPNTMPVAFSMMEGSANELCNVILNPNYKGARDLGTDSDRFGMALTAFTKDAEGGPYAADAKALADKMILLDRLANTRAPLEKQREAAKDLQASLAALKAKMGG